jgi:hypothetical protein
MSHASVGHFNTFRTSLDSETYQQQTLVQLQALCAERKIPNYQMLKKYEIIQLLNRYDILNKKPEEQTASTNTTN